MDTTSGTPRITNRTQNTNAEEGKVYWAPAKSLWLFTHIIVWVAGGVLYFEWSAVIVFILFTATSLCFGHSLGMHRRLIHNSYKCPIWLEYLFVHLGVLVGMAGPIGMIKTHDLRDWAQRQPNCHDYLKHGKNFWHDCWWQLHCDLNLKYPPRFTPEPRISNDRIYQWMERYWMFQQLPWAILLFWLGGLPWVIWGISARICVSVVGHWLVGFFAHNRGQRDWHVANAATQGYNISIAGFISMGEAWHNNHHAYPGSALLGLYPGQSDPGWWVLNRLRNMGLVWDLKLPPDLPQRKELQRLSNKTHNTKIKKIKDCPLMARLGIHPH